MKQRTSSYFCPGLNSTPSSGLFKVATAFFSLLVGQSSHTLLSTSLKGLPSKSAVITSAISSGVVGQPGNPRSTLTTSLSAYTRSRKGGMSMEGLSAGSVLPFFWVDAFLKYGGGEIFTIK